jgi:hypothetical protein
MNAYGEAITVSTDCGLLMLLGECRKRLSVTAYTASDLMKVTV